MHTEKLSISLPTDMAKLVRRQVENGSYASNSEVIRDALRLWLQRAEEREERLHPVAPVAFFTGDAGRRDTGRAIA
jgi:antitoxin ParD1/3/4